MTRHLPSLPPPTGPNGRLRQAYGPLLRRLLGWAFGPVRVVDGTTQRLAELSQRGTLVFVGRSGVIVTFLFLQHLLWRLGLAVPQAVVGLTARVWRPEWRWIAGRLPVRAPLRDRIVDALESGAGAHVFLRRPGYIAQALAGMPDPFPDLVAVQRRRTTPILLVPQVLIWERRSRNLQPSLWEVLFGDPESPGLFRSLLALVFNRHRAFVKFAEPIDVQAFLAAHPDLDDRTAARKLRGALHQYLSRETRVAQGPPQKHPDRVVEETLRDRQLRAVTLEVARERGRADGSVDREAERCVREIAARYSPTMVDVMKWFMERIFTRIYDGLDVDVTGLRRIEQVSGDTPVVLCPSHKSHIDYLVMGVVCVRHGMPAPHVAAGVNLDFPPIGSLFRRSGAFFIRRSFKGDRIYGAALKAYIRRLLKEGFLQEFFVEGGRSRSGKVLQPRYGMVSMEVDAWCDGVRPDIAFAPVWIGYSRLMEAESYAREIAGNDKAPESLGALLRAPRVLKQKWGRVYIRFDEPVSLAALAAQRGFDRDRHTEDQKRSLVRALGFRIIEGINRATALTPSGLLGLTLLSHERRGLPQSELVSRMALFVDLARERGAGLSFPDVDEALDPSRPGPMAEALELLTGEKSIQVAEAGGGRIYSVPDARRVRLDYYKNASIHFFVPDALLCCAVLTGHDRHREAVEERVRVLSRWLKQEFIYEARPLRQIVDERLQALSRRGILSVPSESEQEDGRDALRVESLEKARLLASLLTPFLECYAALVDGLDLLDVGAGGRLLDTRTFLTRVLDRHRAGFLGGKVRRAESLSRVTLENALQWAEDAGWVERTGDRGKQLRLTAVAADPERRHAWAAELRAFLPPTEA